MTAALFWRPRDLRIWDFPADPVEWDDRFTELGVARDEGLEVAELKEDELWVTNDAGHGVASNEGLCAAEFEDDGLDDANDVRLGVAGDELLVANDGVVSTVALDSFSELDKIGVVVNEGEVEV